LSYCGVQNGRSSKLLSNKPPPVEEAQSALPYPSSLPGLTSPGLTRGPIHPLRKRFFSMDARVKPGHDEKS